MPNNILEYFILSFGAYSLLIILMDSRSWDKNLALDPFNKGRGKNP